MMNKVQYTGRFQLWKDHFFEGTVDILTIHFQKQSMRIRVYDPETLKPRTYDVSAVDFLKEHEIIRR